MTQIDGWNFATQAIVLGGDGKVHPWSVEVTGKELSQEMYCQKQRKFNIRSHSCCITLVALLW